MGDVVLSVAAVLLKQLEVFIEFLASMPLVQLAQLLKDNRPSARLVLRVLDARNGRAIIVIERNLGEFLAPLSIDWIFETL